MTEPATDSPVPKGPADGRVVPRFAGPDTFARLPRLDEVDHADVAVFGLPFDSGTTYRPGARFGPAAIRAGSKLLRPFNPELGVDTWSSQQVADAGDLALNPFSIESAITTIETQANKLFERADVLVALGGDHTIALPLLRSTSKRHGKLALIHFDAHLDTWDTYFGAPYTHGTPFRRAAEEGLLDDDASMHIGVRGPLYAPSDLADDAALGFKVVSTTDIATTGVGPVIEAMLARVGDRPVYVSVDIDVLDPAHAPGTGTPEPGGLTTREMHALIRGLSATNIVGGDIVEVAPAYDHAELTALAAASIAYELIGLFANRR